MTDLQLSVAAYVSSIAMAWLGGWIAAFLTKGYQLSLSNPFSKDEKGWRWEYQVKAPLRGKFILPPSPLQLLFGFTARTFFGAFMLHYPIFFA